MATCTNYFYAEDQDGNALSENIRASIYKYTADGWTLVGDAWIAPRSGDHLTLTENNSYKAVPITDISGYTTPNEQVWTACSKDITLVYKRICPDPTVSITDVSDRNPESGEVVNFTGYASGGTGHSIVSRKWDFGDGTSSTLSNPSKSWKNTTGSPKIYTVRFTATNDCGKSKSTSTTVTVASEVVKTGIEIQFPSSLNGKQLIAHGAISTVLDLWWTGPAVHGGLWTKGRATWDNIDSSKKYHISVGDACKESPPIDDVYPEYPDLCAGTFANGDDVVILVRNPGFDFRVYGSGNVHTLSGTSFSVLYLDETSGDIITTAFTGKVCGWLGIPSGTECDAFWAEFYDPIFVANYMSIASTGNDMFGNPRTLSWIDHVAFVASLVGSLPVFNIFPFAGVVKQTLGAITDIMRKVPTLVGSDLVKAGKALADICENSPDTLLGMSKSELDELRAALVKAYGDLEGNRIIDDALIACRWFVKKYHDMLERFRIGEISDIWKTDIEDIFSHGTTNPQDITSLVDEFSIAKMDGLIGKLQDGTHKQPLGNAFEGIQDHYKSIPIDKQADWVKSICDIGSESMKAADPAKMADIPKSGQDYAHKTHTIADDIGLDADIVFDGRTLADDIGEVTHTFADEPVSNWYTKARARAAIIPGRLTKKWKKLKRYEKVLVIWFMVDNVAFMVYMLAKFLGLGPGDRGFDAWTLAKSVTDASWLCKASCEDGRYDALSSDILILEDAITNLEDHLDKYSYSLKLENNYDAPYSVLEIGKSTLALMQECLANRSIDVDPAGVGSIEFTSNEKCAAYIDGERVGTVWPAGLFIENVNPGTYDLRMWISGFAECKKTVTIKVGDSEVFHCDLQPPTCVLPVPKITAPTKATEKEAVQFKGSATTESAITWWSWDFGDGGKSTIQNPSHTYFDQGVFLVQLTVTDDCGTATVTHTIESEEKPYVPPEEEAATVYVFMPIDAETGEPLVWQYNPEVYVDGQYTRKAPGSISFGGFNEPEVKGCTLMVRATGYQDKSAWFDLKDKDSLEWKPYMDPEGYVTPVGHPIDFYIPENASLTVTPITTVSRIVAGMKRIGGR